MADRKISDLTALTTPATGDLLPIVDVSESAAADKNKSITVQELFKGVPDGTASAPGLAFESDDGNGIYLAGTDTVGIATGGAQRVTVNASGDVSISGNLTVSGTTTTIDSTTLTVDDKNIELGSVASPSDTTADGGGITLKGASDKTLTWVQSTGMWTSNQPFDVAGELQCDSLDVDGAVDITGHATFHDDIDLQDNDRLLIGSGDDLIISHDGSTSTIANSTGDLVVQTTGAGDDVVIQAEDDVLIQVQRDTGAENAIVCHGDGSVFLYHNNNIKLTTNSTGIDVTGEVQCDSLDVDGAADITGNVTLHANLDLQDNDKILLGTGDDLEVYHDGNNSAINHNGTGNFYIQTLGSEEDIYIRSADNIYIQPNANDNGITVTGGGGVTLYHNNATKLATTSSGISVTGEVQGDSLDIDGAADITGNVTLHANLDLQDNDKILLGSGDDLQIYHDGSNSYLEETGTGSLNLRSDPGVYLANQAGTKTSAVFNAGGAASLRYNNSQKLATTSGGIDITGTVTSDGLDVDGTSRLRHKVYSDENTATASAFDLNNGNLWTFGAIAVPNPTNQTAGMMGSLRVTAAPTSFAGNWKFPGGSYTAPTSFPAVAPFYVQASGTILVGSWTEGIA